MESNDSSCWSPLLAWQTCEKRLQVCLAALLWHSRCHVWLQQHPCGLQQDSLDALIILCRQLGNVPQQTENLPVYLTGAKPNEIKHSDAIEAHSVCCMPGKCSHLDPPIALGRMELLEAWSQGLWHRQGLLCLGTLLILPSLWHCLAQMTGRLSKTQSVDHPDTPATSLWKKISAWRKGFYFFLFSYKMELLFLQPRPLQEILSLNPFCSMTALQNPAFFDLGLVRKVTHG